jgi:hypothetical protein
MSDNSKMFFKVDCPIPFLALSGPTSIEFGFDTSRRIIRVRLEQRERHEWLCIALCSQNVSKVTYEIFEAISAGELREGTSMHSEWESYGMIGLAFRGPESYRSIVDNTERFLLDYAHRTVSAIQWRLRIRGAHGPFPLRQRLFWSLDGERWQVTPGVSGFTDEDLFATPEIKETLRHELESLVKARDADPIGHELLREAFNLRSVSPRSAFILAVASLECGFKQYVSKRIPEAAWLMENIPSPDLVSLLRDYLPKVPAIKTIEGQILAPTKDILDTVRTAVSVRNRLVHHGTQSVNRDQLDNLIVRVGDLLYLLDYYSGKRWALYLIKSSPRELIDVDIPSWYHLARDTAT